MQLLFFFNIFQKNPPSFISLLSPLMQTSPKYSLHHLRHFKISTILVSQLLNPQATFATKPLKIIIDCDIGLGQLHDKQNNIPADIDDAYVLINALNSPQFEMLGLTTVFGNTDTTSANQSLDLLLGKMNKTEIPRQAGAQGPSQASEPCPLGSKEAANFLFSKLKSTPAHILAIGPLTNISCLLSRFKNVKKNIKSLLVVMGQSKGISFAIKQTPLSDFNFEHDVAAVQKIIAEQIPTIFFPFELTNSSFIERSELMRLGEFNNLAKHVFFSSKPFLDFWQKTFNEDGFHPWDSATLAYLKNPSWFKCDNRLMVIEKNKNKIKLSAKPAAERTPWKFCYRFRDKDSQVEFQQHVLESFKKNSDKFSQYYN